MKLIVGLGNIGKEYANTRHNIGFEILNKYLKDIKWSKNKFGLYCKIDNVIFLKPSTYMNLSGNAVKYFMEYYKIKLDDLLVIHDDLDLNIGKYRLKKDSSDGGHNGVKSIIESLGNNKFLRLKIGISHTKPYNAVSHVLGVFTSEEKKLLLNNFDIINNIILDFISNNSAEYLMNKYN